MNTTPAKPDYARQSAPYIVAVCNGKGGVGKTTIVLNLAAVTSASSGRALVADTDPQRAAEEVLTRAGDKITYDYIVADNPDDIMTIGRTRQHDTIFADTPGSLEQEGRLRAVLKIANLALIPVVPEVQAFRPTLRTIRLVQDNGVPYFVVINMVDPLRGSRSDGRPPAPVEEVREWCAENNAPCMRTYVRRYVSHPQAQLEGVMITDYRGDRSAPKALSDIRSLQAEMLIQLARLPREDMQ